jgi:hypothetical protein
VRIFSVQNLLPAMTLDRISRGVTAPSPRDPAPPTSTPSSSTCLPRFGGLLSCLGIRRSSAPPAPRTPQIRHLKPAEPATQFHDLKPDTLALIANKLAQGPRAEAVRDVVRLSVVNQALREAVTTDPQASRRRMDGPVIGNLIANAWQLIKDLLRGPQYSDSNPEARVCLQALGLLDRQQQATLVRILMAHAGRGIYNWTGLNNPFSELAPRLAELDPPLRAELVERAIRYEDAIAATAIGAWGGALAHLEASSIDRLVHKATTLRQPLQRACAIRDLSAGCGHMNDTQRQHLWQATLDLQEYQGVAIQGLGAQLKHLLPDQQTRVFERALHLTDARDRHLALIGLAASIEVLDPVRRQTLFTQALGVPAESHERAQVICALAAGLEHMTPVQRTELVVTIRESGTARAVAVLGAHPQHVDLQQLHQLLGDAAQWPDGDRLTALAGNADSAADRQYMEPAGRHLPAVTGFVAGLQHMEPACRRKVGALALGLDLDRSKALAIGALGPHLKHLDEDQRHAVVEQACRLLGEEVIHRTVFGPHVRMLTTGLGAGMAALRVDQRDALAAAVAAMPVPSFSDPYLTSKMRTHAEAVAGLASGQQHLSEAGFAALVQAATHLQGFIRAAMGGLSIQREMAEAMEAKATALFGLVRG